MSMRGDRREGGKKGPPSGSESGGEKKTHLLTPGKRLVIGLGSFTNGRLDTSKTAGGSRS